MKLTPVQIRTIDRALRGLRSVLTQVKQESLWDEMERNIKALEIIIADLQVFRFNVYDPDEL